MSLLHLCVSKLHIVWELHSACRNLTMHVEIALCVYKLHLKCVLKSHFAFRNYTMRVNNDTRTCCNHTLAGGGGISTPIHLKFFTNVSYLFKI
jgi:hypothetical protein